MGPDGSIEVCDANCLAYREKSKEGKTVWNIYKHSLDNAPLPAGWKTGVSRNDRPGVTYYTDPENKSQWTKPGAIGKGTATGNCAVGAITISWEDGANTSVHPKSLRHLTVEQFQEKYHSVVSASGLNTSWVHKRPSASKKGRPDKSDMTFLNWYNKEHRGALKML